MNANSLYKKFLSGILILILIGSSVSNIVSSSEQYATFLETEDPAILELNLDTVNVYYDPQHTDMSYVAQSIYNVLSFRLANVNLIAVSSLEHLKREMYNQPWIGIYAFNGDVEGI